MDIKKLVAVIFICWSVLSCESFAKFWEGENLINVGYLQTGYSLMKSEKKIDMTGTIYYGLSDRFTIGTNLVMLFFGNYSIIGKFLVIEESSSRPSIAFYVTGMGGDGFQRFANSFVESYPDDIESITAKLSGYYYALCGSKPLNEKTYVHCSMAFSEVERVWDVKYKPESEEVLRGMDRLITEFPGMNLTGGVEYRFSEKLRGICFGNYDFDRKKGAVGLGVSWASGRTFRVEVGKGFFHLYWRY